MSEDAHELLGCIRTGTDLAALTPRPLRYAVPGIFPEGLTVLAGAPKRGKSWLALDACLAVAGGGKALGAVDVAPGRALYLALEDSERRLQSRARHLLGSRDPIPDRFDYVTTLTQPARFLELLATYCTAHPDTRLVVVDTLARVRPAQPKHKGAYDWDYAVGAHLKRVADDHGIALVAVTHTRQMAATDFVEAVSGTSGLTGAADTIVVLDRARGQDDAMLKVTGRDVDEREYAMRMVGGAWQLLDRAPVDPSLSDRTVAILDLVAGRPEGTRADDVAQALSLDVATARTYLRRLADADRIGRRERGLYVPLQPPVSCVPSVSSPLSISAPVSLYETEETQETQVDRESTDCQCGWQLAAGEHYLTCDQSDRLPSRRELYATAVREAAS